MGSFIKTMIMKNWTLYLTLFCLALTASMTSLQAQKFGHLNVGNLLSSMPEAASADKSLETYQTQLVAKGEEMALALKTDYETFSAAVQQGTKTQAQIQEKQQQLQREQEKIAAYEQKVMQDLTKRREELLAPLLDRVNNAIQEVGKENGFTFIFDSSIYNAVMFAEDSTDVDGLVRAKLGL